MVWPVDRKKHQSHLARFDGSTYQGQLRSFGIVNPINYAILSKFIAENWANISGVYTVSRSSGHRPKFPKSESAPGRAFEATPISKKRKTQKHLASSYPLILDLDISRFYDSLYTHSIPWATLDKNLAKQMFSNKTLKTHWSDELDILVRNCNNRQTIGVPIGPDTSRIISEIILSRLDYLLCRPGSGLKTSQVFHNIDDYQFGVLDKHEAELAQSAFVRAIREYELRLNDFKTELSEGIAFAPSNWHTALVHLQDYDGSTLIEKFFDSIYDLMRAHPSSNVAGYFLKQFSRPLMNARRDDLLLEYLQRFLFAAPYLVRWIAPLYLSLAKELGVTMDNKRVIDWCLESCCRRNDVVNATWFLYAKIYLGINITNGVADACFALRSPLLDLQIMHMRSLTLSTYSLKDIRYRYGVDAFNSSSWLFLYEVERRAWDVSGSFQKFGLNSDYTGTFSSLAQDNVEFYRTDEPTYNPLAFEGWKMKNLPGGEAGEQGDEYEEEPAADWEDHAGSY